MIASAQQHTATPHAAPMYAKRCPQLFQRLIMAEKAFAQLMATTRQQAIQPTPIGPALQLNEFAQLIDVLIKDPALQKRLTEDFAQQMRDELPPEQGNFSRFRKGTGHGHAKQRHAASASARATPTKRGIPRRIAGSG